ncbi:hypothetical protein GCG54_00003010 [Colletotrichum gloeosporioides]|uniref:Metal tolerance protein 3 n=5 Tax=Colletotrichum gloeosporioides species complex TaxID=2707338 RepID=T0JS27_COLGC|nr:uncharacterized protein GCG54_00003010 [Colletotrichum gloeosporioides]EQB43268.1 hypothetical protein CGLO_18079 [Colletotrichum gloeosporioides Cg-14]KAF3810833.1 hypothetical protein GCG54_00003010 [Colletotrichum gloeosporioides]
MHAYFLAQLLLAATALANAIANPNQAPGLAVVVRQAAPVAANPPSTIMSCAEYSRIANLSTVGANSTYRATFFAASPNGNQYNAEVLDTAIAKLPTVIMDQALNTACGNLTALALVEAERNFTQRTVLQLSNIPVPDPLTTGPVIAIVCASIVLAAGSWVAMPDLNAPLLQPADWAIDASCVRLDVNYA